MFLSDISTNALSYGSLDHHTGEHDQINPLTAIVGAFPGSGGMVVAFSLLVPDSPVWSFHGTADLNALRRYKHGIFAVYQIQSVECKEMADKTTRALAACHTRR